MGQFLSRCILFLALTMLILTGIWKLGDHILQNSNDSFFSFWNELRNLKAKPEILFLGNSRAMVHYNTALIDSNLKTETYNLGMDGYTSIQQEYRYRYYRQYNKKPKLILINVDDETFFNRMKIFQPEQYYPFLGDSLISNQLLRMDFSPMRIYIPQVKYYGASECFTVMWNEIINKTRDTLKIRNKGFIGLNKSWQEHIYQSWLKSTKIASNDSSLMLRHEKFINSLKEDGIRVILVFAPQYSNYTDRIVGHKSMIHYIRNLASRLGVYFWDYSSAPICRYKSNFCEPHHLNFKSANRFSIDICRQIRIAQSDSSFGKKYQYLRNDQLK